MPFVWSVGTILGPSIGGYFASPAQNFPDVFAHNGLFGRFPYLLPNVICAGLMTVSIVLAILFLEETHPDMQPWSNNDHSNNDCQHFRTESSVMTTQATDNFPAVNLRDESYGTFNDVSESAIEEEEWNVKPDGTSCPASVDADSPPKPKVFTKRVIALTLALGIFTYHAMTFENLLPIYFQDDRGPSGDQQTMNLEGNGSFAGGLGLSVQKVGVIMSLNGVIALFVQGVIFPLVTSWLGIWKTFIVVAILHPLAYFIMPFLSFIPTDFLYYGIYLFLFFRNCLAILAYPVLLILLKEASPAPSCLGKINGLAASTGAACRTIASPVAGLLYGVGIKIDFTALAWWASALVALVGALQALTIRQQSSGTHHQVRAAFMHEDHSQDPSRRPSVVHIRVRQTDSGYASEDERTPLIRQRG